MSHNDLIRRESVVTPYVPPVDVFESDHELLVVADVPGVSQDALELVVEAHELRLATTGEGPRFARTFHLPDTVDGDGIRAELRDGVLAVHLPKAAAARPRRVQVAVA